MERSGTRLHAGRTGWVGLRRGAGAGAVTAAGLGASGLAAGAAHASGLAARRGHAA